MPKKLIIQEIRDGFITPVLEPEAYIFGAGQVVDEILEPTGQWVAHIPSYEIQQKLIETSNCTAFGSTSQIEALEKRKFGTTPNYSDRYLGIRAGTRPPGNDPQKVYETIRAYGLAPEECLPFPDNFSLNDYYSFNGGSETDCDRHAKDWKKKYILKHEWLSRGESIPTSIILEALKRSPIAIAVFAWASDGTKYVRAGNDTHWCVIVGTYSNGDWMVLDSYAPFIKRLDKNFGFNWAKRIWLGKNEVLPETKNALTKWLFDLANWAIDLFLSLEPKPEVTPDESLPPPAPPTPKPDYLHKWALAIQKLEGFFAPGQNPKYPNGTIAWRNNNPGNLRASPFQAGTRGGFAYFKTYEDGLKALKHLLISAATGKSRYYKPEMNLIQFFSVYAPVVDDNQPTRYARFVAKEIGLPVETKIRDLVPKVGSRITKRK